MSLQKKTDFRNTLSEESSHVRISQIAISIVTVWKLSITVTNRTTFILNFRSVCHISVGVLFMSPPLWSSSQEFLAAISEVPGSIPSATRFSE
jgi:hypothetical protein